MRNWKSLLTIIAVVLVVISLVAIALGITLTDFIVDFWWFTSLDYGNYFWLRRPLPLHFSGGVTIFFFLIFFMNFWVASRYLGVDRNAFSALGRDGRDNHYKTVLKLFQSG